MGTCPTYPLGRRNYMGVSGTVQIGLRRRIGGSSGQPLAHARTSSTGHVVTMRSAGMPRRSARSQPSDFMSSWPGACASESMVKRQPRSRASSMSSSGGSQRSGRELISTATSCSRQARKTFSASNCDGGRLPRPPVTSWPVQWREDVGVRVAHGRDHPRRHLERRLTQLRVDRGGDDVELVEHVVVLVERAVEVDVDLDALEQRERVAEARVDRVDALQLVGEALAGQPVGDGEARGVVGQRHPLLPELDGGEHHLLDGAAAVAPVGVRVQVTAEGGIQLGAAAGQRRAVLLLRRDEVCRQDARARPGR